MMFILGVCLAFGHAPQQESSVATVQNIRNLQANSQQVNPLATADQFFEDALASDYMRIICPGDGNCFYHAIAQSLGCEMMSVRHTLRTYLEENHDYLVHLNDYVLLELFLESDFETLLESVGNAATSATGWAGLPHAKLVAWAYEVPVVIYSHLFPEIPIIFDIGKDGNQLQGKPIQLFYVGGHWDRLVPYTDFI